MALLACLTSWWAVPLGVALVAASYLWPYFVTHRHLRGIPAPWGAQVSNLWLALAARRGQRYWAVDEAHNKLGNMVRVQPNHVSVVDESAVAVIYGHGNGLIKGDFYDVFVSIQPSIFSTRSRCEHTRKRKMVSHAFSARSVAELEPYMGQELALFVARLDELVAQAGGEARVDLLLWFSYLAFDMIGDLAFGAPFGMLEAGSDVAEARLTPDSAPEAVSAIELLNRRGETNATLGCLTPLGRWAVGWLPRGILHQGLDASAKLAGIAVARVKARLDQAKPARRDLLSHLVQARDAAGQTLPRNELTAEALAYVIAGSDTTANSSCALANYLLRHPRVLHQLQRELDAAVPAGVDVPSWEMVRSLEYLGWTVLETLRHHATSAIGLPRLVPHDSPGITILGRFFPPGTVLSVPTYSLHRCRAIWGPDALDFRPERWANPTPAQKTAFIPFGHGPRACVGRNVAEMEMKLIAATWIRRYSVALRQGDMETREGFLRKPMALQVALSQRPK
ncbi:hypothetical protein CDD81_6710 [Ophiocordyceps australis]|uniref:Cytochrome P450 n=1 Tax=Ophiocordyceps australis TaxID=1399860 RepID=A0A2C5XHI0_9HYPO|nr:hypothetical protein CDD81_6710 [Ophiocordyceps australis]